MSTAHGHAVFAQRLTVVMAVLDLVLSLVSCSSALYLVQALCFGSGVCTPLCRLTGFTRTHSGEILFVCVSLFSCAYMNVCAHAYLDAVGSVSWKLTSAVSSCSFTQRGLCECNALYCRLAVWAELEGQWTVFNH